MEREACVCDHGYERSDLCAEIIIIIIIIALYPYTVTKCFQDWSSSTFEGDSETAQITLLPDILLLTQ